MTNELLQQRQVDLLAWAIETFGDIAADPRERALRLLEEALEVVQATGLPYSDVMAVAKRTYDRPCGDLAKELGGLVMTTEALAQASGIQLYDEAAKEYQRITSIPKDHWAKRHAEKVAAGTALEVRNA